ncbi:MrcB family domain-containing protein [Leptothoe sp. PORK10 BA2]|uniref:MrcB family domain-containing protein n=1 Tax=Leptothoe sp. PORK10 BA2 TaxID=3110254 RepID=UPI002B20A078|nr:DUF3578 domain-containing protein [Leptothoe sp. PORK10 BA2]MEA5465858.1 DUF3578 domain-containing protein [Leptothoe sp. PORK10 BA2]
MPIKELLHKVLLEYPEVSKEGFKGHQFSSFFRKEISSLIKESLDLSDIYSVKASTGNGAWAKVPWIAIFNKLVTESVTSGFYCVYLFRVDCSGVYLSLNQGIAAKRDQYGLGVSRDMIRKQAKLYREILTNDSIEDFSDPLDLKLDAIPKETTSRRLGLAYEAGNVVSKLYSKGNIPDDSTLVDDITKLLDIYFSLFQKIDLEENREISDDKEDEWFELDSAKFLLSD